MFGSDHDVRNALGEFIREFNQREWYIRKNNTTTEEYTKNVYSHKPSDGYGFVVEGRTVPYFHPNRSFHDEIIWLNRELYYRTDASFGDKLVNSAIVKFYGPSRTVDIITGHADLSYLTKTDKPYVIMESLRKDADYTKTILNNIELASKNKEKLWGTTELRTSLQTASRDYSRTVIHPLDAKLDTTRSMRPSDMIWWLRDLSFRKGGLIDYFQQKPTMEQAFNYLTSYRGIGNYYGYHFASNLARMPGIGSSTLIEKEYAEEFKTLGIEHGNLDENADFVVAGPGAMKTLSALFPSKKLNTKTAQDLIIKIRDNQEEFFGISSPSDLRNLRESTELGKYTTFGVEIACCQFSVFERLRNDKNMALNRSRAPISQETVTQQNTLEQFWS